jgi:hypothetical protein
LPDAKQLETAWRWGQAITLGCREFAAANPALTFLATYGSRAVFQTAFFALLGETAAGADQRRYAFIGATAVTSSLMTVVAIADVPALDKWEGTSWRLRLGRPHTFVLVLLRVAPYPAAGLLLTVIAIAVAGPLLGLSATSLDLLALLPLYTVIAMTSAATGLAGAALAVGKRADVLVGNALAYVILLTSGALIPPARLPLLDAVGTVLPIRHALSALRALVAGQPWNSALVIDHVIAEMAVGASWLTVAWAVTMIQLRRVYRSGYDNFT